MGTLLIKPQENISTLCGIRKKQDFQKKKLEKNYSCLVKPPIIICRGFQAPSKSGYRPYKTLIKYLCLSGIRKKQEFQKKNLEKKS